ncbi:NAD-dependent epimerase/dehydratase family protein [Candidatus Oleimmundimicrobium sp.]|uniref:NAD-dependent epimerase/dehydratase family protein n=1 Tax=Candidatus Oleimmundimicrobium sp. TaxID=3060597 RepID=UPI0027207F3E|nr:NAD-dependent epimerase/dehydratase family protein [Candidatus Oleimmundimicrobium sp.]MDO8886545.1 NAD-dependent epimerase/dehydratase family protein [Candidatus Oleimmundimicrobium sp.]
MKILVTGGAGFIGSHIVDTLIGEGHEVVVVDNLSTGFKENVNSKAKFYEMNIVDRALSKIFDEEKPDIVNHHAAQIDVRKSVSDPIFDAEQNIIGSLNVIENSVKYGVKKLIYASTGGALYGEIENPPADENHPISPISNYAVSKCAVEFYLLVHAKLHGLNYTTLRYANVYGPRQNSLGEAGVVAIFARQLLMNEQPTIFGDGSKTRDYVSVFDVVEANKLSLTKGYNGIYNIGTGVETSDKEVFDIVAQVVGVKAEPKYAPVRPGEVNHSSLDSAKVGRELGWKPKISLKDGVANTVAYFRKHLR